MTERLDLEAIEARREASCGNDMNFIVHAYNDIPALVAEVRQLRRELHDEQIRRDEWEKMYDQAVAGAGTEIERLRASLEAVLEEAESDLDRDIILAECSSALIEDGYNWVV